MIGCASIPNQSSNHENSNHNKPSSVYDGSAITAMKQGEISSQVGAKKHTCEPYALDNNICRWRTYTCKPNQIIINKIEYKENYLQATLCNIENLSAEQATHAIGIQLKERIGNATSDNYGIYKTDSPYLFAEIQEYDKNNLKLYYLYSITPNSNWYGTLPIENTALYIEKLNTYTQGYSFLPLATCPSDKYRDEFIQTLQKVRPSPPPKTLHEWDLWRIDKQLFLCGHEDEARAQVLTPIETGRWSALTNTEGLLLSALPNDVKEQIANSLLSMDNREQVQEYLELISKTLNLIENNPEELAHYFEQQLQKSQPTQQQAIFALKTAIQPVLVANQQSPQQCWQQRYSHIQQAYQQRLYATAFYLAVDCKPQVYKQKIDINDNTLNENIDIAVAQIAGNLYKHIGLRHHFKPETNNYDWQAIDRHFANIATYYQGLTEQITVPELFYEITLDNSIKSEFIKGYSYWEGASNSEQEATRQKMLNEATDEVKQLINRRDELLTVIDKAQSAIDNAGSVEYKTQGRSAPSGIVNNTQIWTDRFGIQHTETSYSKQGGQTFGGVTVTIPKDTSDARKLKQQAQNELIDINKRLSYLKTDTLSRYEQMQPKAQKQVFISDKMKWSGYGTVNISATAPTLNYQASDKVSFDFDDPDGYRDEMTELQMLSYHRNDFRLQELFEKLTFPVIKQRVDTWLNTLPDSTHKQLERDLLNTMIVNFTDNYQHTLVKQKLLKTLK